MGEGLAEIRLQVTPGTYRARAISFVAVGLLLLVVSIVIDVLLGRSVLSPGFGLAAIAYGIFCAVRARRKITRLILVIDATGIRSGDGVVDRDWRDVVMVWIGAPSGLRFRWVLTPALYLYTGMGVDYARRAGTRPKALYGFPVEGDESVRELCRLLREVIAVPVVDGTVTSRRDAERALDRGLLDP